MSKKSKIFDWEWKMDKRKGHPKRNNDKQYDTKRTLYLATQPRNIYDLPR